MLIKLIIDIFGHCYRLKYINMKKFTKEKEDNIIKMYDEGKSITEIALIYNTFNTSIRRVLKRNDKILLNSSQTQSSIKENPFKDLSDAETQYWLGLLCTDGNVYKNRVSLDCKESDLEHLEKYKQFVKTNNKVLFNTHKKFKKIQCSVRFKNQIVANYLINLGITPNKTHTLEINFPITFDFLRGAIDGDGCIEIKKGSNKLYVSLATASEKFKNQISNFLAQENIKHGIYFTRNLYIINISAKQDVKILCQKLYNNARIFLPRKKEKYLKFLDMNNL